jgi:hypothetical protein
VTTTNGQEEYVGIWKATQRAGRSAQWIQRRALLGKIRTRLEPGEPPKYLAADIDAAIRCR